LVDFVSLITAVLLLVHQLTVFGLNRNGRVQFSYMKLIMKFKLGNYEITELLVLESPWIWFPFVFAVERFKMV